MAAFLGNLAGALFIVWLVDRTLLFREETQDPSFSGVIPWAFLVQKGLTPKSSIVWHDDKI